MNTVYLRLQLVDSSIHGGKPVLHGNFDLHYFVLNANQVVCKSMIKIMELNWAVYVAFKLYLELVE